MTFHTLVRARFDFVSSLLPAGGLFFSSFDDVVTATSPDEVIPALARVESHCRAGGYAAGFVAYEAATAFDSALLTHSPLPGLPLLAFGLALTFQNPDSHEEDSASESLFSFSEWTPLWNEADYAAVFARIQARIYAGDSYQTNLTFPLRADFSGDPFLAYQTLRQRQRGDYAAFLDFGERQILSLSPELFFEREGDLLRTRPMKGTAPRGLTPAADSLQRDRLLASEKERAENLMIVDLLRNDLGRLAVSGGVRVPSLLDARRYPTLWQLTSTVEAKLPTRNPPGLADLFRVLFPCGSVTGAPKANTMRIIRESEPQPRGVYCGAVGVVLPGGECVFNVPIRTLLLSGTEARYNVGGGLVADATAGAEYEECRLKAKILTRKASPEFELLESILWLPQVGYVLLAEHLKRLRSSAEYFQIRLDEDLVRQVLGDAVAGASTQRKIRLLVAQNGMVRAEATEYGTQPAGPVPVRLASGPVDSSDLFLYHKTTHRVVYNRFRQELSGAFDVILFNENGELTEGTICNVALRLNGEWYTPPVSCGLLAGVQREVLLRQGTLRERVLLISDLPRAEEIRLMNSVRGILAATLVKP